MWFIAQRALQQVKGQFSPNSNILPLNSAIYSFICLDCFGSSCPVLCMLTCTAVCLFLNLTELQKNYQRVLVFNPESLCSSITVQTQHP